VTAETPYPGLRPFQPDEVDVFFGREQQIDQLLDRLGRSRLLGVVGSSGCGKSSLVKAGLIPALETGLLAAAGARWRYAEMRPGNQPLLRLAEALLADSALGPERAGQPGALGFVLATLRRGPLGLAEVLADTPPPEGTRLLLVVDQFEEIFRYVEHGDPDEADAFVALLLAAAADPEAPIYVVLTMRSDYIGDCALFEGLPEALNESQFLTPRMTRAERREAMVGPAGVFGAAIEPALVNRLLNDMGADPDQLPRMQHLLMRLWHRAVGSAGAGGAAGGDGSGVVLAAAGYEAVGGFADCLSNHADEAFEEIDLEGRRIAEHLFRALSERGDDQRDVRRPARLGEVAAVADVPPERVAEVVEVFRRPDRSFLTPPAGVPLEPDTVLDVSHESLIRQWRRLRSWVEEESQSAALYRRLTQTAGLWRRGEAGLWGPPDLDIAVAWRDRRRPTAAWAERYGGRFETAMEFLAASQAKRLEAEEGERRAMAEAAEQKRVRQRNRLLTAGLLAAGVLLLLAFSQWRRADRQRDLARRQTLLAEAGELIAHAQETLEDQPQRSLLLAVEALDLKQEAGGSPVAAVQALQRELSATGGAALSGHRGEVVALAVTPDGRTLATASRDGTARLWDLSAEDPGAEPRVLGGHGAPITAMALDPAGRRLATGAADGSVRWWRVGAGPAEAAEAGAIPEAHRGGVTALAFDPSGRTLLSGGEDGAVRGWDLDGRADAGPRPLGRHSDTVRDIAVSDDGRWLASVSEDNTAALVDLAGPAARRRVLAGHRGPVSRAVFVPGGRWLATASHDNTARLWDLADPSAGPIVLCGHTGSVVALAATPDGGRLVTGSGDATARVWRMSRLVEGATARATPGGGRPVVVAALGPGSCAHLVADAGGGATWDVRDLDPAVTKSLPGHGDTVTALAISAERPGKGTRFLATASRDQTVRVWNLTAERPGLTSLQLRGHDGAVGALAFNPHSAWLYSGSADATARRWKLDLDERTLYTMVLAGPLDAVRAVDVSADGHWLAAGSEDNDAYLWDLRTSQPPETLGGHDSSISAIGLSPDGRWLATTSEDNTIRLWDLAVPGAPASRRLGGNASSVTALAFTPDGRRLATAGRDGTARVWSLEAADPSAAPTVLCGHRAPVVHLDASPDGRWLVTAGRDGAVRLWDLAALGPVLPTAGSDAPVIAAALPERECRRRTVDGASVEVRPLAPAAAPLLPAGEEPVTSVAFVAAREGGGAGWLASGDAGGDVHLWDLTRPADPEGRRDLDLGEGVGAVTHMAAGPAGRWLAVAAGGTEAYLLELAAEGGPRTFELRDHRAAVVALAFDPAGAWLATGSADGEARLWSIEADDPAAAPGTLYGHRAAVTSLAFGPDGRWLATGSRDHTVRVWKTYLWSLGPEQLVELACRVAGRDLTRAEWEVYLPFRPYRRTCTGRTGAAAAPAASTAG